MVNDRDIAKQIIQRDIINAYNQLPIICKQMGLNLSPIFGLIEDKVIYFSNIFTDMALNWLFGADSSANIDEAADIAKMMTNDKIEEYRKKIREAKKNNDIL